MIAGFARMQHLENELVPELLRSAGVDWLLELAPAASPSPAATVPRHRMLLDDGGWMWPCRLTADRLPFGDETLPAVMIRHLFWIESGPELLGEAVRCLKPGGLLVSVSANPFHRGSWQELGRDALRLPAWPRFVMQHGRHELQVTVPRRPGWRGMVPGIAPLLLLSGRKPPRGQAVTQVRFRRPMGASVRALPTSCRAA